LTRLAAMRPSSTATNEAKGTRARRPGRRYAAAVAEKRRPAAADPRLTEQDASARQADYAFDLKRRLEAAVEGDPGRFRAIARARRNKRSPRI
jgi:hypothetical protein